MQINLLKLMGDEACYNLLRELGWEKGVQCPHCQSFDIIKDGKNETHSHRQNYRCHPCLKNFDDLTSTVFSGSKLPLKTWILCLYLMGLNLSNSQISKELDISQKTAQSMTKKLRSGIVKKSLIYNLKEKLRPTKSTWFVDTKVNHLK